MRTRKGTEFIVGLVSIIALVTLFFGVLWLKGESLTKKTSSYSVLFPMVGGLQTGDPVHINGTRFGSISSISLADAQILVTFSLPDSLKLYEGSMFSVMEVGLLGEKKIEISYVKTGPVVVPIGQPGAKPLTGEYIGGLAETVGEFHALLVRTNTFFDTLEAAAGSASDIANRGVALMEFLDTLVIRLDTISRVTSQIVTQNDDKINEIVENARVISRESRSLIVDNKAAVSQVLSNADSLTGEMQKVLTRIDRVVAQVDTGNGTLAILLRDTVFVEQLESSMQDLDRLVGEIREDGLKLRVKFGHKKSKKGKE